MYKWVLGIVIGLSVIASVSVMVFGLRPKPIPIIKSSNFEEPEKLANYIHRQLYERLKTSSPILIGFEKNNEYQLRVVTELIQILTRELKDKMPEVIFLSPEESYTHATVARQDEMIKKYGGNFIAFTMVDIRGVPEANDLENCEMDHDYKIWLDCTRKQKVRQMIHARKVDPAKTLAQVENQSQKDIMIYIRE